VNAGLPMCYLRTRVATWQIVIEQVTAVEVRNRASWAHGPPATRWCVYAMSDDGALRPPDGPSRRYASKAEADAEARRLAQELGIDLD